MLSCGYMWTNFAHDPLIAPALVGFGAFSIVFLIIALWSLAWKAMALWHAAKNRQRLWFIALLIINTAGILEIVYLAWFAKDASNENSEKLFPYMNDIRAKVTSMAGRKESSAPEHETVVKVVEKSGPDNVG